MKQFKTWSHGLSGPLAVFVLLGMSAVGEGQATNSSAPAAPTGSTASGAAPDASAQARAEGYFQDSVAPLLAANAPEDQVRAALQECLAIDPGFAPALYRLGVMAEREESWAEALDDYQKAEAAIADAKTRAIVASAVARMKANIKIDSTPSGKQARQYDSLLLVAKAELGKGEFQDALANANKAATVDARRWEAYLVAAAAQRGLRHFSDEVVSLQMAIDVAPPAAAQAMQKPLAQARHDAEPEVKRKRFDDLVREAARYGGDNPAEAASEMEQAFKLFPDRADVALRAAGYHVLARQFPAAVAILKEAEKTAHGDDLKKVRDLKGKLTKRDTLWEEETASDLAYGLTYDNIPPQPLAYLRKTVRQSQLVRDITIIDNNRWVILYDWAGAWWNGIPQALADAVNRDGPKWYVRSVSFDANGGWALLYGYNAYETGGLPGDALATMRNCVAAHLSLTCFAQGTRGEWALVNQGNGSNYTGVPDALVSDLKDFNTKRKVISAISISGSNFCIMGPDYFWYYGPQKMIDEIKSLQAHGRAIKCVALAPNNGWVVVASRSASLRH